MHYSRDNPSPRYLALLEEYKKMHVEGDAHLNYSSENTYSGACLQHHVSKIKKMIALTQSKTLLDYGSGKARCYDEVFVSEKTSIRAYFNVEVTCFDPAYAPFCEVPRGKFDGVICIDVLEHIPKEDLVWVIHELFQYADKFVYINVDTSSALRLLPSGENAHCTVKSYRWWYQKIQRIAENYPDVLWKLIASVTVL